MRVAVKASVAGLQWVRVVRVPVLAMAIAIAPFATSAASSTPLPLAHVNRHAGPPVVVVVAEREAVLSDFLVPYGVLSQSGAAKVIGVNISHGPLQAGPLTLLPDMTAAEFDRTYPDGADYVIVPATADKHSEELAWLRSQRAHGAAMISICDGVELLAEIGALDGRQATGHWASLAERRKSYPKVNWLTNTRYVADGDVASSAGVSASMPISLALVETIAGAEVARETAERLGVKHWDAAHNSDVFKIRPSDLVVHSTNMKAKPDLVAVKVHEGDDEVALSLHAEAWSRTMRNDVRAVSNVAGPVQLRGGLRVEAQRASSIRPSVYVSVAKGALAGMVLNDDLDLIAHRYGRGTARFAALGMEYPWGDLNTPTELHQR